MKIRTLLLFAFILLLAGGFNVFNDDQYIKGNGNVLTTTRFVDPFSSISIDGVFNIYLSQGNEEKVEVETDENIQDYIEIVTRKNRLTIRAKDGINIQKSTKNNIYIALKDIHGLEINSVGRIECETVLSLDKLSLEFNGVGKTHINVDCNQFNADIASVGSLVVEGSAKSANINQSGVGSMKGFDFIVDYLSVDLSGIGSVEVYARKEISINSNGIGSVKYKGPAELVSKKVSGIGSVKHVR